MAILEPLEDNMKHQWYGDKRDIVKWGTLITLCQRHGLKRIFQVAMLTQDSEKAKLKCNGKMSDIPLEVWNHFRDVKHVKQLGQDCGIEIEVFDEDFRHGGRIAYFQKVLARVQQLCEPTVVFLDPDTGIQPNGLTLQHVSCQEISAVWQAIQEKSCLVIYQHRPRELDWHTRYRTKFEKACENAAIEIFESESAKDVAFFAVCKR